MKNISLLMFVTKNTLCSSDWSFNTNFVRLNLKIIGKMLIVRLVAVFKYYYSVFSVVEIRV